MRIGFKALVVRSAVRGNSLALAPTNLLPQHVLVHCGFVELTLVRDFFGRAYSLAECLCDCIAALAVISVQVHGLVAVLVDGDGNDFSQGVYSSLTTPERMS